MLLNKKNRSVDLLAFQGQTYTITEQAQLDGGGERLASLRVWSRTGPHRASGDVTYVEVVWRVECPAVYARCAACPDVVDRARHITSKANGVVCSVDRDRRGSGRGPQGRIEDKIVRPGGADFNPTCDASVGGA